jgi:hypothetical protein
MTLAFTYSSEGDILRSPRDCKIMLLLCVADPLYDDTCERHHSSSLSSDVTQPSKFRSQASATTSPPESPTSGGGSAPATLPSLTSTMMSLTDLSTLPQPPQALAEVLYTQILLLKLTLPNEYIVLKQQLQISD